MLPVPSLLTVAKYGFISMIVTSAGFLIGNVIFMKHHAVDALDDLVYKPRTSRHLEETALSLDRGYSKCFTEPTKSFSLGNAKELFRNFDDADQSEGEDDIESPDGIHMHPIHLLMDEFSGYMLTLGIRAVILEPSMLFCSVSTSNKYKLLVKGFNPHDFQGSHQTVTVGIFEADAKILEAAIWGDLQNKISKPSFEAFRTRSWRIDAESDEPVWYSVHFLLARGRLEVHAVVLFARNGYLWHAGTGLPSRELLFMEEGTYENFTAIPLVIKNDPHLRLYLPDSPVEFLFQIPNSQFLNCQPAEDGVKFFPHPSLTEDQLVNRAVVAVQELKAAFQPHLVNFWLWTESLRGWFKTCNIFEETSEMSLALSHSSVKKLNLTAILANNNYLDVLEMFRMDGSDVRATLDCYGLRINIFICHEEQDYVWYLHNTEQNVNTKRFRLCTSDVFGQRIYVPCEAELIIQQQTSQPTTPNALDFY